MELLKVCMEDTNCIKLMHSRVASFGSVLLKCMLLEAHLS